MVTLRARKVAGQRDVRCYIPQADDPEPTDHDFCYDVPAKTDKDLPARWYIKIERDPERAARLEQQQNAVIIALLRWASDTYGGATPRSQPAEEQS